MWMSVPQMIQLVIINLYSTISFYYVSLLRDEQKTAAIGFANFIINILCIYLFFAINQAFLCRISENFGKEDHKGMQIYFLKTLIINCITFIIMYIITLKVEIFCQLLGFNSTMTNYIEIYLQFAIIGGFFYGLFDFIKTYIYVVAQEYQIGLYINIITVIMQFILGGYLINMGIKGMGINMIIVHLANLILILLYCRHMDYLKLDLISNKDEVLSEMKEYSQYVLQITVISYADQLSFEIMTLMSASLHEVQLAAHVSLGQFYEFVAALPLAYHVALSNQSAEKLARGELNEAYNIIKYGLLLIPLYSILATFFLYSMFHYWVFMYTMDDVVIQQIRSLLFYAALLMLFDYFNVACQGVLKGIQQEDKAIRIILLGYFIIFIPLGFIFKSQFQLKGIWSAIDLSAFIIMILQILCLYQTKYDQIQLTQIQQNLL